MARANLNIQTQINEEFLRSHDSNDIRLLKVKIEEENLILDGVVSRAATPAEDFNTILLDSVQDNQASFILYRVADDATESGPWVLIAWVPDGCRVRDKMLYSSSKEDLKRSIGLSFFRADYAANQRSDLTWEQFMSSQDRSFDADILTESERLVLEEKVITVHLNPATYKLHVNITLLATSAGGELCLQVRRTQRAALRHERRGDHAVGVLQGGRVQLGRDDHPQRGDQPGRLPHYLRVGFAAVLH